MGKTNKQTYDYAKQFIGKGGATFRKYCGLPSGAAWCNAYVTYIFHHTDNANLYCGGKKQTYCPTSIKWCKANLAQVPLYLAMPMDVIYFDWDKNGVPNHIGFVRDHKDTSSIYTIEGNTDGGRVALKTRPAKYVQAVYRPHFKPTAAFKDKALAIDGVMGYQTIYGLQKALKVLKYYDGSIDGILGLKTVKALQKWAGCTQDGQWGKGTSKAVQKRILATVDGDFGKNSVKQLQKFINANAFPSTGGGVATAPSVTSNAQKIVNKANELAWKYGTPSSKWSYKGGAPTSKCKTAMNKYGYNTKEMWSDCGRFATTVVRESGVDPGFVAMKGVKDAFPKSAKFNIVLSGKRIPSGFLKAGDIVRYKKTKGQHTLIYMGNNRVCEARHYKRFGNIVTDEKRYNKKSTKAKSIQVLRAR